MGRISQLLIIILIGILSCTTDKQDIVDAKIDEVRERYAPDPRTAIFDIKTIGKNPVILSGETNLKDAKEALLSDLVEKNIEIDDKIILLPDQSVSNKEFAIINVSVANLRGEPGHSAELVTQALLGTPVKVLREKDNWCLVQTPDQYIAWTNNSSLYSLSQHEFDRWKTSPKVIFLDTYGFSYQRDGEQRVSDLVAGSVLELEIENNTDWFIKYPDGRLAKVEKTQADRLSSWHDHIVISNTSFTNASRALTGVPYLWGGTSTKGVDCSGFTKTIYMLHGYVIPRDASQQVHTGIPVDSVRNFSGLEVGDLLFFGRKNEDGSEKVIHVGLWLGNHQFIHASGDVHISSMDSTADNYDNYNYHRYLRTKRIIGKRAGSADNTRKFYSLYKK